MNLLVEQVEASKKKWSAIIEHADLPKIESSTMRNNLACVLENSVREGVIQDIQEVETTALGSSGLDSDSAQSAASGKWDPIVIAMIRRTMPQLIANELMGVQPMTGPTGLIFAMQPVYRNALPDGTAAGADAFGKNVAQPGYSGNGANSDSAGGMTTAAGEILGADEQVNAAAAGLTSVDQVNPWNEMGFTITKRTVSAKTRALKAHYTDELAQDLRVIHGLDAEQELSTILTTEVIAEMNREMVGVIRSEATIGAQGYTAVNGTVDVSAGGDTDGRWLGEMFAYLAYAIQKEAAAIALTTRRGRGNFVVTSSDVITALEFAGKLRTDQNLGIGLNNTVGIGTTFVGTMGGGTIRVYVDPYLTTNEVLVGYKGANAFDAGYFFCPYVPLQMYKARGEEDFQPRIGMKTRYGLVGHPQHDSVANSAKNDYYRKFTVTGL